MMARQRARNLLGLIVLTALVGALGATPAASAKVKLSKVGRFNQPTYVSSVPGAAGILVVEKAGRIVPVVNGKRRGVFLDIRGLVNAEGERGLLSIAFPPNHQATGLFYAYYTNRNGDNVVAEYHASSPLRAEAASRREVLLMPHPGASNHNGGQLQFGPDGLLYISTGDGGGAGDTDNSAQTTDNLLGKILRIDPQAAGAVPYTSPPGNPFAAGAGRDEIFAIGLRNPFRFSFDGSRIVIADVGQDRFEEVDYEELADTNGANFGWNDFEALTPFSGAIAPGPPRHDRPIYAYSLTGKRCALIGGYVVRTDLGGLRGRYLFGDFCDGVIRSLRPGFGGVRKVRKVGVRVEMLSSFGESADGKLFATSLGGPVYRFATGKKK